MLIRKNSEALFSKAKTYFPGGVNSPVRAFGAVGGTPLFIDKGDECYDLGCRWQFVHRLLLLMGPFDFRTQTILPLGRK